MKLGVGNNGGDDTRGIKQSAPRMALIETGIKLALNWH